MYVYPTSSELELSTHQQSQSVKWKESRVGSVTASRFSVVEVTTYRVICKYFFFDTSHNSTIPALINHGLQNEVKACNAYCSKTGFVVRTCGLVVNPSLPCLDASPDGLVEDPLQKMLWAS